MVSGWQGLELSYVGSNLPNSTVDIVVGVLVPFLECIFVALIWSRILEWAWCHIG